MLELFLGEQQPGEVTVGSILKSLHHSEVARFGTNVPAQNLCNQCHGLRCYTGVLGGQ